MRAKGVIFVMMVLAMVAGCDCEDHVVGWDLYEEIEEPPGPPIINLPDPTTVVVIDIPDEEEPSPVDRGWVPEEVVPSVPRDHALNERTSLAVDPAGTIWIGFHACPDQFCLEPALSLARKERGGTWTFETIKPQTGTFGIDVAIADEPVAAFLDPTDFTFKAARRVAESEFEFHSFDVQRGDVSDGLDIAVDGERIFVTFASASNDPVRLFVLGRGLWTSLERLPIENGRAARERGLRADGQGNLYLVHRNLFGAWGVAEFQLSTGTWGERTYLDGGFQLEPSSMVVTSDGEVCISGTVSPNIVGLSCGATGKLDVETFALADQLVDLYSYSSMVEGSDGTLYIAYNTVDRDLRVAKESPGGEWSFETIFQGETYGVSTAIDHDDLLVISYYTCDASSCRLESISRAQDIP